MRNLTTKEQELYDNLISLINKYLSSKKRKEEVIGILDKFVEELTDPHIDIDALNEYFFGSDKK